MEQLIILLKDNPWAFLMIGACIGVTIGLIISTIKRKMNKRSSKMEQQKCPHCGTTRIPVETVASGGAPYIFCPICKETITHGELLDMGVEEQRIDVRINYYYDEKKEYAIIKMADWEKVLKILKEGGAELHRSED